MKIRNYLLLIVMLSLFSLSACARDGVAGKYECPVQDFPSFYLDLNSDGTFWVKKPSNEETTGTWERHGDEILLSSPELAYMVFPAKLKIQGDMLIAERPEHPIPFNRIGDVSSSGGTNLWPLFWVIISIGILALGFFIANMFIKIPLPLPMPHVGPSTGKRQMTRPELSPRHERIAEESKLPPIVKPSTPGFAGSKVETPVEPGSVMKQEVQPKPVDVGPSVIQPVRPPVESKPPVSSGQRSPAMDAQKAAPVIIPAPIPFKPSERTMPPVTKAKLVLAQTGRVGHEFAITKESVDIGRWDAESQVFPEIDLTEDDPGTLISRRHARIFIKDDKYYIVDVGSANGTFVNRGSRLAKDVPQELSNGDEIVIGHTFLKFVV
jgi:hypothetical protein